MRRDYSGWTAERFKREVEALGVEKKSELRQKDIRLYGKGLRKGWLDAVFPKSVGSLDSLLKGYVADGLAVKVDGGKMRRDYSGWTVERFKEEVAALDVKSRNELRQKDLGLYCKGLKEGWLNAVLGEPLNRDYSGWTVERFKEEVAALDVKGRKELLDTDLGLYKKGWKEGWLDAVFGEPMHRDFSGWTAERYQQAVEALDVKSRGELSKKDDGLYAKGRREGWLGAILGEPLQRDYSGWTVERFKKEVEILGVKGRKELEKNDSSLYQKGLKEGWLGAVFGAGRKHRSYSGWTIDQFKKEVEALGVRNRKEIEKKACGLYEKGLREGWLDVVFGKSSYKQGRDFSDLTVEQFKQKVEALGVEKRNQLCKKDPGLYSKGIREGWLDAVFGKLECRPRRDYSGWTVERFKQEVEALGVKNRGELCNKDKGLYGKGLDEDWLGAAFGAGQERRDYSDWTAEKYKQEVEALDVKSRKELQKKDGGLYAKGVHEGWLHAVFGAGRVTRDYSDWTIEIYKREVEALGVKSRKELEKKAKGLYWKGGKEGWLDIVFPKSSGSLDSVLENYVAHESSIDSKVGEK